MSYRDVALTGEQLSALKRGWRKTGWRLKALKAKGKKLPDEESASIVKIDRGGAGSKYALDTAGGRYVRAVHDRKGNRTFVLHYERLDSTSVAVVSIINHAVGPASDDYIDTVNKTTSDGWPAVFDGYTVYASDMDFNPDTNELALAAPGMNGGFSPALLVINCAKYKAELFSNSCNELAPNPEYLDCRIVRGPTTVTGTGGGAVECVRYFKSRWWTWTRVRTNVPYTNCHIWQLGYFDVAGNYKMLAQYGHAPGYGSTNGDGDVFDGSARFPERSRWCPVSDTASAVDGADAFWGDPASAFENVTTFEVQDTGAQGEILMCTTPYRDRQNGFGIEAFIFRIDIEELLEADGEPEAADTFTLEAPGVWNPGTEKYEVSGGTVSSERGATMIRGYCSVRATQAHTGSAAGGNRGVYMMAQTRFGTTLSTSELPEAGATYKEWHVSTFCDAEDEVVVGMNYSSFSNEEPFTLKWEIEVYPLIPGLAECIGIHSDAPLVQSDDADRPELKEYAFGAIGGVWQIGRLLYEDGKWTQIRNGAVYSESESRYVFGVRNETADGFPYSGGGEGLWTHDGGAIARYTAAPDGLEYDCVGRVERIGDEYAALACNDGVENNLAVQFFRIGEGEFLESVIEAEVADGNLRSSGLVYDPDNGIVGFASGKKNVGGSGEMWFMLPETVTGGWSRDLRMWWDGSGADAVIGDGEVCVADDYGQPAAFYNPRWTQGKGLSSYRFSFTVEGAEYLPWTRSRFNENADMPGTYDGALGDATRLVVERGVWDGGRWTWVTEGQVFIVQSPAAAEEGAASMEVTAMGAIAMLVTRATYEGYHSPVVTPHAGAELASDDGLEYYREDGAGGAVTDWASRPEPIIYVDGALCSSYTLDSAAGTVTFVEDMTGKTVTATFNSYEPGTNEAEDIIRCILTYPQELGGCGLDETYITRNVLDEELTRESARVYAFSIDNVRAGDGYNKVRVNGAGKTEGVDFTWYNREGKVTFEYDVDANDVVTGDCTHYTIRRSGMTLKPISLTPREQNSAYEAVQEVCRRVAPNYIFREGRDGKLECGYFTQKPAGEEDIAMIDADVAVKSLSSNPIYEGLATRVISFGMAELQELPNYCFGKPVTDNWSAEAAARGWPKGWHPGVDAQCVVDGDPGTGATTGYGEWDEGTYQVQYELGAAGLDGIPCLTIDMEEPREVDTVVIARPSQVSTEGEAGAVQSISVWISSDGVAFEQLIRPFTLGPGENTHLKAGTNFEKGIRFQYIRINAHSLGLYRWGKGSGKTHSQFGVSEVQCYPDQKIMGEARLQTEDPEAALYDVWGLLDRYGILTHVARGGAVDEALVTQEQVDLDARYTLEEIVRLISGVEITAPWLPGIPVFSTVRIVNSALGVDATFFIEDRSADANGDTYTGTTLP